ncbi:Flp family type IVb pilin [Bradyrhizobium sp.]|uniref:Flp family type IVb pilin n=1 Tax=Bradyrhizobium sp. TaxID=376 RepID=UPI003F8D75D6
MISIINGISEESHLLNTRRCALRQLVHGFLADRSAATAIEYALIAGGISIAIIVAVNSLGTTVNNLFTSVSSSLK